MKIEKLLYYFRKIGKESLRCWKRVKDAESALLAAEFSLMCHYSNVEYDNCYIANVVE